MLVFGLVVGPFVALALLEWSLVRYRPNWVARLAFLPIGESQSMIVHPDHIQRMRSGRPEAGYRASALSRPDVRALQLPAVLEADGTIAVVPPGSGLAIVRARNVSRSKSTMSIARLSFRLDGDTLTLSGRIMPSLAGTYLVLTPLVMLGIVAGAGGPERTVEQLADCAIVSSCVLALPVLFGLFRSRTHLRPHVQWAISALAATLAEPPHSSEPR